MTDSKSTEHREVLIADLPDWARESNALLEKAIRIWIEHCTLQLGVPKRIWMNPKDAQDIQEVDGYKIERRHGCPPGKVMLL